ncbi:hypothetical protein AA15237_0282 [Komagataeibacter xylinus NBRC 15237]|uniref:hypothetical protein n=2 Tax=Komagataeibacter xylinus TaxID=28448 RepID=UPI002156AF14|nr:hypothetical protein [Komagataeibacter xylinus]GBQ67962.1 hypothetical protein AA15237_0282 [Komagataeibacter xylinus NBRC 15237]
MPEKGVLQMESVMPVFALIATPAVHRLSGTGKVLVALPMDHLGNRGMTEARTLADLTKAVTLYGDRIATDHPGRSFSIGVHIRRGDRKPRGFDTAYRSGALGTDKWIVTVESDAAEALALNGPASGVDKGSETKGEAE